MRNFAEYEPLLAALHLQADAPLGVIAKSLRRREHQVRYAIQVLESEGIFRRHPFVDVYPFGFTQYEVYTTLAAEKQKNVDTFLNTLIRSPLVPWVGSFAGEFQIAFTLCTRNPLEVKTILDHFSKSFGEPLFQKSVSIRISYTEFFLKLFSTRPLGPEYLTFGGSVGSETIDELDHKILRSMCSNEPKPLSLLAEQWNIALSTVYGRLQRLREKQIYRGDCGIIDFGALGLSSFKLLLTTKYGGSELRDRLFAFARKHQSINYFVECIGGWDFEIGCLFRKPEEVNRLVQEISQVFYKDLLKIQTLSAFSYPKVRRYPFEDVPL